MIITREIGIVKFFKMISLYIQSIISTFDCTVITNPKGESHKKLYVVYEISNPKEGDTGDVQLS